MFGAEIIMKSRINSLQAVRAFAFLGVFACHSGITVFSSGGAWGVSVFLILSGFLMLYSYFDTDRIHSSGFIYSVRFGISKIKKIYPLHIATMLLALPYLILGFRAYPEVGIMNPVVKIAVNTFLVQSWIPVHDIYFSLNGVSWYLSVSLFLYIMFPFILSQMRKYRGISTAFAAVAIGFAVQVVLAYVSYLIQINVVDNDDFIRWFAYIFPLSRLEDFVIGCNLGYIFLQEKKNNKIISERAYTWLEIGTIAIIVVELAAYVLLVTVPSEADPTVRTENWWGLTVMWTLPSCAFIYLFALNKGKLSRILTNKTLLFIGNLSANAFLIHHIVYRYLTTFEYKLFGSVLPWVNLFACFLITLISSWAWDRIMNLYFSAYRSKRKAGIL